MKKNIKLFLFVTIILLIITLAGAAVLYFYITDLKKDLPQFDQLEKYEPRLITKVISDDDQKIKEFFEEKRNPVDLDSVPKHLVHALLATEDREFYSHWGFNTMATIRAALLNVPKILTGRKAHGASTITQQLARNLYRSIGFSHSIERKVKELLTSVDLERMYSKKEILEMYLTQSTFGPGVYGIQSGAKFFFDKNVNDLTIEESALLIAQLKAPAHYNPYTQPERAFERRNLVMHNMLVEDYIDEILYTELIHKPIVVVEKQKQGLGIAPYFTEYVRQQLNDVNSEYNVDYLNDGLTVYTTLDSRMQEMAEAAIDSNIVELTERTKANFIKNESGLQRYVKTNYDSLRWNAKMKDQAMIDSVFEAKLKPQVAILAVDPRSGEIKAMVGGLDFQESKYNRAVQAWRQPGSIFKPIVYLSALDNGWSPNKRILNQPMVIINPDGTRWSPGNYDRDDISGLVTLRYALKKSLNNVSARVINELVSPAEVVSYAKKLGIDTRYIQPYPSIALGSGALRPIDIITAYCAIANKGTLIKPYSISKIEDRNGKILMNHVAEKSVALSPETSFIITDMMKDVVKSGTAVRLGWKYGLSKYEIAGKTGTTNSFADAWFCGFTPELACVVWVGLDDHSYKLGEGATGSNTALPIWGTFVKSVFENLNYSTDTFEIPDGVEEIEICSESFKKAGPYCPKTTKEYFNKKYNRESECDIHSGKLIKSGGKRGRY